MDYIKGFKILFEDKNTANNLLIGSVMNLIPIVGPIVLMGWQCEIFQRLHRKNPDFIPRLDFNQFGHYLGRGLVPFLVALILTLPFTFVLAMVVFILAASVGIVAAQGWGPVILLVGVGGTGMVLMLGFLLMIVFANAGLTRAYLTEDFSLSMDVGRLIAYAKKTWKPILVASLVYVPLTILLAMAGTLCLYFGIFPAMVISNVAWIYISWQIYELFLQEGGEAIPLKSLGS